tara:strand:+ start:530 stop:682 length:153 start_codon:yes stop_codon:yes gene_type:complete
MAFIAKNNSVSKEEIKAQIAKNLESDTKEQIIENLAEMLAVKLISSMAKN